jgi:OOP family OmpA-OmpF porin
MVPRHLLTVALIAPLASACASTRIASPTECAVMGAALLGGAGAATGIQLDGGGDEWEEGLIGAGAGMIAGAGAGYLICSLWPEAKPEPKPAPPPPPAPAREAPKPPPAPAPERIVLRGVNFAFNSDQVDAASMVVLDVAAETLRNNPGVRVSVEGHTDSVGADAYNQGLSERRAESVRRVLIEKGVPASRLTATGFGESRPVASNDTEDGRRMNRRVELNAQ